MKKILFTLVVVLFCTGSICAQYDFSIVQKESRLPISIGADTISNRVYTISFPLIFEITNNTLDTLRFSGFQYHRNPLSLRKGSSGWDSGGLTYNYTNKKLDWLKERNPARFFKGKSTHTYVHITSHSPSNDSLQKVVFKPYLDRMRREKVTVLEIESIQELKKKNPNCSIYS